MYSYCILVFHVMSCVICVTQIIMLFSSCLPKFDDSQLFGLPWLSNGKLIILKASIKVR